MRFLLMIVLTMISTLALGVELREIEVRTGTAGLTPAPLIIANSGSEPLSCVAELAHWYSKDVAEISPGAASQIDLWFDPESGAYLLLNDRDENMPVESLWCGQRGRAYETRARFILDRKREPRPGGQRFSCRSDVAPVVCR